MKTAMKRWRGLKTLVIDVVDHGSSAVEKVHLATAKRTFDILEAIPGIDAPSKVVHVVHDVSVRGVYGMIRAVTHVVGAGVEVALDAVETTTADTPATKPDPGPPTS